MSPAEIQDIASTLMFIVCVVAGTGLVMILWMLAGALMQMREEMKRTQRRSLRSYY